MSQGRIPKTLYMYTRGCTLIKSFSSCKEASYELGIEMRLLRIAACQECAARRDDEFIFSFRSDMKPKNKAYVKRWETNRNKRIKRRLNEFGHLEEIKKRKCNMCDRIFNSINGYRSCPDCTISKSDNLDVEIVYGSINSIISK